MRALILFLCLFEIANITWLVNWAGPYWSPALLLASSIAIAFIFLHLSNQPYSKQVESSKLLQLPHKLVPMGQIILFAALSVFIISILRHTWWVEMMKVGEGNFISDVIPQLQALVTRFLQGEQPYYPIHFINYDLYPTYLPLQWMPYTIAQLLHKDYRLIAAASLLLASAYYFFKNRRQIEGSIITKLLLPIWPLFVWAMCIVSDYGLYTYTVEALIAGYYFFVAESLQPRRLWPIAIGVSFCLLSRYSIVLWVPFLLVVLFVSGQKRQAVLIAATSLIGVLLIYWMPFLRFDGSIFTQGFDYHTNAALNEWKNSVTTPVSKGYLFNGLGFTAYLSPQHGDIEAKLALYKKLHLVMCILALMFLGLFYWRTRHKYTLDSFLLFSFKIYLAVFYAFIQIPYKYLLLTPVIVSASLLVRSFIPVRVKQSQRLPLA